MKNTTLNEKHVAIVTEAVAEDLLVSRKKALEKKLDLARGHFEMSKMIALNRKINELTRKRDAINRRIAGSIDGLGYVAYEGRVTPRGTAQVTKGDIGRIKLAAIELIKSGKYNNVEGLVETLIEKFT